MKSRDLIIKSARRLDKFTFEDIVLVSELEEQEVTDILSKLLNEKIIVKNNNTYFFNIKNKSKKKDRLKELLVDYLE